MKQKEDVYSVSTYQHLLDSILEKDFFIMSIIIVIRKIVLFFELRVVIIYLHVKSDSPQDFMWVLSNASSPPARVQHRSVQSGGQMNLS